MINAWSLAAETLEGTLDETYPIVRDKINEMKLRPKMRLSDKTLMLLKNFSTINQSILFKQGNSLRTISVMKNILAEATIEEDIPKDFGVYDLNQFLNALSLHQKPELDFKNEAFTVISEDKARSKYFFADPNVIVSPPEKEITLPTEDVCFQLNTQQLDKLLKAAAVYQVPDLSVIGENGTISIVVRDKKNDTSNHFSVTVGETTNTFMFNFKVENIKILPGSYNVVISSKLLSCFTNADIDVKYYIALEPDSTFE
tara:strand:- start:61 stop:831 length:771 start_codon:yes stop_codon:yes gene_type:complete